MSLPSNDAEVERLVLESRLFGAVRGLLLAAERVGGRSRVVAILARRWRGPAVAQALVIASIVHAALVTAVPAASAPLGRYSLALAGLAAAALVAAAARVPSNHVRHLR